MMLKVNGWWSGDGGKRGEKKIVRGGYWKWKPLCVSPSLCVVRVKDICVCVCVRTYAHVFYLNAFLLLRLSNEKQYLHTCVLNIFAHHISPCVLCVPFIDVCLPWMKWIITHGSVFSLSQFDWLAGVHARVFIHRKNDITNTKNFSFFISAMSISLKRTLRLIFSRMSGSLRDIERKSNIS